MSTATPCSIASCSSCDTGGQSKSKKRTREVGKPPGFGVYGARGTREMRIATGMAMSRKTPGNAKIRNASRRAGRTKRSRRSANPAARPSAPPPPEEWPNRTRNCPLRKCPQGHSKLSTKPKGFAGRRGCSLLRALACGRRSHTCRLSGVFCEVHAPANLCACGRKLCEALLLSPCLVFFSLTLSTV